MLTAQKEIERPKDTKPSLIDDPHVVTVYMNRETLALWRPGMPLMMEFTVNGTDYVLRVIPAERGDQFNNMGSLFSCYRTPGTAKRVIISEKSSGTEVHNRETIGFD